MATVEIRLASADVPARIEEVRRWLDARGIRPSKVTSTGSAGETLVLVEFAQSQDAEDFAREFSGNLVQD